MYDNWPFEEEMREKNAVAAAASNECVLAYNTRILNTHTLNLSMFTMGETNTNNMADECPLVGLYRTNVSALKLLPRIFVQF